MSYWRFHKLTHFFHWSINRKGALLDPLCPSLAPLIKTRVKIQSQKRFINRKQPFWIVVPVVWKLCNTHHQPPFISSADQIVKISDQAVTVTPHWSNFKCRLRKGRYRYIFTSFQRHQVTSKNILWDNFSCSCGVISFVAIVSSRNHFKFLFFTFLQHPITSYYFNNR